MTPVHKEVELTKIRLLSSIFGDYKLFSDTHNFCIRQTIAIFNSKVIFMSKFVRFSKSEYIFKTVTCPFMRVK